MVFCDAGLRNLCRLLQVVYLMHFFLLKNSLDGAYITASNDMRLSALRALTVHDLLSSILQFEVTCKTGGEKFDVQQMYQYPFR